MSTQLQYTSSIFQLALGVNAVFAILLNQYLAVRAKLVDEFIQKLKNHNPSLSLDGKQKHLIKYLFRAMRGYRVINAYFILCVVLAVFSGGISLYYLLRSALAPTEEIASWLLTALTLGFLAANPVLYFGFLRVCDWLLLQVKNNLTIQADHVSLIEQSIELSELCDSANEIIAKAHIHAWEFKKRRLIEAFKYRTEPIIHPIRFICLLRARRAAERIRRRNNDKNHYGKSNT